MKEFFSQSINNPKDTEHLPQYIPHPAFIYVKKEDEKSPSDIITLAQNSYLLFEELPPLREKEEPNQIIGYLSTIRKKGKSKPISRYANAVLIDDNTYYELQKKSDEKIVGYLKTIEPKCFIAVTKERNFIPLLWLISILILIVMLFVPQETVPIFGKDKVTNGGITPIEIAELEPNYFNIKINATPILENGKMNIRIENSLRNIYDCYVEVFVQDKVIYKSPLLHPDESLEFATVKVDFTHDVYDGIAVFHLYDNGEELEVTSSVKLKIDVR